MKLWFEWTLPYWEEKPKFIGFALDWYKHKRKEWKGWTFEIVLLNRIIIVNFVNNYKEYDKVINYRKYRAKKRNPNK